MADETSEMIIKLEGRIDSNNVTDIEKRILNILAYRQNEAVIFDAENLDYISSAGLRTLLRVKKSCRDVKIINVRPGVYEILDTTGFTQLMTIEKAYRRISVDGCEEIGRGASGTIYRIDQDNVVKVYNDRNALDEIIHEREMAKLALILGIPTAISYEIVRIGDCYGSVFELLDAVSFSQILSTDPLKLEWCVEESIKLLNMLHTTHASDIRLPDIRDKYISKTENLRDELTDSVADKVLDLIRSIPLDDRLVHGDFHSKNIMLLDNDVLLIDMETLSVGHPIFDLASMYDAYIGFSDPDHDQVKRFQGFDYEISQKFWYRSLETYLNTQDKARIREVEDKAKVPGYVRAMNFLANHKGNETKEGREQLSYWKDRLIEVLERIDSLDF